jgi:hypothetical protein
MAFPESIKLSVKQRAHFACCLCHDVGVEVHHIIPQSEGGADTEDNAAPLCPSCHEIYGANPQKRKFIRQARDFWYETCERRYQPDADLLRDIADRISRTALQEDLIQAVNEIQRGIESVQEQVQVNSTAEDRLDRRQAIVQLGTAIAVEMATSRVRELLMESNRLLLQSLLTLNELADLDPDLLVDQWQHISAGPVSDEPIYVLMYSILRQDVLAHKLGTTTCISSSVVPALLDLHDDDPELPIPELLTELTTLIRSGELDRASASVGPPAFEQLGVALRDSPDKTDQSGSA